MYSCPEETSSLHVSKTATHSDIGSAVPYFILGYAKAKYSCWIWPTHHYTSCTTRSGCLKFRESLEDKEFGNRMSASYRSLCSKAIGRDMGAVLFWTRPQTTRLVLSPTKPSSSKRKPLHNDELLRCELD